MRAVCCGCKEWQRTLNVRLFEVAEPNQYMGYYHQIHPRGCVFCQHYNNNCCHIGLEWGSPRAGFADDARRLASGRTSAQWKSKWLMTGFMLL